MDAQVAGLKTLSPWQRIIDWVLPPIQEYVPIEMDDGFADVILVDIHVHLRLRDRLRVLLLGNLVVGSQTYTEHKPGTVVSHTWINTS